MSADLPTLHDRLLGWYDANRRDLPWRRPATTAWAVVVSEFMLQQTQVDRVRPFYDAWITRWPTPADLAAATSGDAIRAWGRLGYPRRALRLHAAATAIVEQHAGQVPSSYEALRSLPGVGDYTAAAVASFAFGQRHVVLDTNVRRVLGRVLAAEALPGPSVSARERERATRALPDDERRAARWAVATMELGALVCTARAPSCPACPVRDLCAWRAAGRPAPAALTTRTQRYAGTDRQERGRVLAVLRDATGPVEAAVLAAAAPDHDQHVRALASLVADGLAAVDAGGRYTLPAAGVGVDSR